MATAPGGPDSAGPGGVLLGETQAPRRERAGHRGRGGSLVWASPALAGATHGLSAARAHGIVDQLSITDVTAFADRSYQGAGGSVRTPFKRHRYRPEPSRRQRAANRSPRRATAIVQAILAVYRVETSRYSG
jgi:hypothetical protein